MSLPTLHISRWNEVFENADTRKRERLKSFHAPSGCDSRGYLTLVSRFPQDHAMMAFGVFQALCQLSATLGKSIRGRFENTDHTPMDLQQLACLLRIETCHLSAALEILTDTRVGWCFWSGGAVNLPVTCQPHPGFVQGEGEGEGEALERERRASADEASRTPENFNPEPIPFEKMPPAPAAQPPVRRVPRAPITPGPEESWESITPRAAANDALSIMSRINGLNPEWRKRPSWMRSEMDALHANLGVFADLQETDWSLLTIYMGIVVNPGWKLKIWQPDIRIKFVETINDVLMRADEWVRECKRRNLPTGLETAETAKS